MWLPLIVRLLFVFVPASRSLKSLSQQADDEARPSCKVCHLGGTNAGAPVLTIEGHVDGTGRCAEKIVFGMALAAKLGLSFGGAELHRGLMTQAMPHGRLLSETIPIALGVSNVTEVLFESIPERAIEITDGYEARIRGTGWTDQSDANTWKQKVSAAARKMMNERISYGVQAAFTQPFIDSLRSQVMASLSPRVRAFKIQDATQDQDAPVVALHLRRGDVTSKAKAWFTADAYYEHILDRIQQRWPDAQIHLFSEGAANDFEKFARRGAQLHLDGDPMDTLAHLAFAPIFVSAKGAFSWYAMLLNSFCVVGQPPGPGWGFGEMPTWLKAQDPRFDQRLSECVRLKTS